MMEIFKDQYEVGELLGSGAFAETFSCTAKSDSSKYAVKIIKNAEPNVATEIDILRSLDHVNIVRLYAVFQEGTTINMVQELVHGGEMFDYIIDMGTYSEADANRSFGQILKGLNYLHSQGILHRDLKPENILLTEKTENATIKIADFGLAKVVGDEGMTKTTCGTPGYVAPEVLLQKNYGTGVDVWAAGVILYIMVSGYEPFYHANEAKMFKNIMAGKYSFSPELFGHVSDEIKDIIKKILVTKPESRPSAEECLAHPWLKEHNDAQKTRSLQQAQANISKLQAKKRFKGALIAVRVGEAIKGSPASGRQSAGATSKSTEEVDTPAETGKDTPADIVKDTPADIVKDGPPSTDPEAAQPEPGPAPEAEEQLPGQVPE